MQFTTEEKRYMLNALDQIIRQTGLQDAAFALGICDKLQAPEPEPTPTPPPGDQDPETPETPADETPDAPEKPNRSKTPPKGHTPPGWVPSVGE